MFGILDAVKNLSMKNTYTLITIATFLLMLSCRSEVKVAPLDNNIFLEEIYDADQSLRKRAHAISASSPDYMKMQDTLRQSDELNYHRLTSFLQRNGYPDTSGYSMKAIATPWKVFQNCRTVPERLEVYPHIKKGYAMGHVSDGQLWSFLSRTYSIKFGERHEIDRVRDKDYLERIPILESELGLDKK